jgi:hypothetical protein
MASKTINITTNPRTGYQRKVTVRLQEIGPGETREEALQRCQHGSYDLVVTGLSLDVCQQRD